MNNVHFMSKKDDWETPQSLFDKLHEHFHFTLDAAASDSNHKLPRYYTKETDGLAQDWGGERVFCNPPYGNVETGLWTQKCWEEAQKPNTLVVLLIPARTDRKSFHDFIYNKPGVTVHFLKGRLKFEDRGQSVGTAPFPSMLCIFNKEETNMPTKKTEETATVDYTSMNACQKLQIARLKFLQAGVKKTGKNIHLEFMYFELQDIVPSAESIFSEVGLLMVPTFGKEFATAKVYNVDDREEDPIVFEAPFTQIAPIVSNTGKVVTNEMQALGSSITYMRRYLWQLVLDIIESDSIDNTSGADDATDSPSPVPTPKPTKKPPVTQEKRQEIKTELTSPPSDSASEEQIKGLKSKLKELMEIDPEQESFVQSVAVKTEGFTKITADACAQLIAGVTEMLTAYESQEG